MQWWKCIAGRVTVSVVGTHVKLFLMINQRINGVVMSIKIYCSLIGGITLWVYVPTAWT